MRECPLKEVFVSANLHDAFAAIGLPQYADLLFGCVSFAFHDLSSF
jgi:hypothetical protein